MNTKEKKGVDVKKNQVKDPPQEAMVKFAEEVARLLAQNHGCGM